MNNNLKILDNEFTKIIKKFQDTDELINYILQSSITDQLFIKLSNLYCSIPSTYIEYTVSHNSLGTLDEFNFYTNEQIFAYKKTFSSNKPLYIDMKNYNTQDSNSDYSESNESTDKFKKYYIRNTTEFCYLYNKIIFYNEYSDNGIQIEINIDDILKSIENNDAIIKEINNTHIYMYLLCKKDCNNETYIHELCYFINK